MPDLSHHARRLREMADALEARVRPDRRPACRRTRTRWRSSATGIPNADNSTTPSPKPSSSSAGSAATTPTPTSRTATSSHWPSTPTCVPRATRPTSSFRRRTHHERSRQSTSAGGHDCLVHTRGWVGRSTARSSGSQYPFGFPQTLARLARRRVVCQLPSATSATTADGSGTRSTARPPRPDRREVHRALASMPRPRGGATSTTSSPRSTTAPGCVSCGSTRAQPEDRDPVPRLRLAAAAVPGRGDPDRQRRRVPAAFHWHGSTGASPTPTSSPAHRG